MYILLLDAGCECGCMICWRSRRTLALTHSRRFVASRTRGPTTSDHRSTTSDLSSRSPSFICAVSALKSLLRQLPAPHTVRTPPTRTSPRTKTIRSLDWRTWRNRSWWWCSSKMVRD